jgi:hypothetical protein
MITDYYFWFTQPPTTLENYDLWSLYLFGGMALAALMVWAMRYTVNHEVIKRALNKWIILLLSSGLSGLVWFAFRYENTPIFAKRFWAGIVLLSAILWAGWILKYMLFRFNSEKTEYDNNLIKSKYMPSRKK